MRSSTQRTRHKDTHAGDKRRGYERPFPFASNSWYVFPWLGRRFPHRLPALFSGACISSACRQCLLRPAGRSVRLAGFPPGSLVTTKDERCPRFLKTCSRNGAHARGAQARRRWTGRNLNTIHRLYPVLTMEAAGVFLSDGRTSTCCCNLLLDPEDVVKNEQRLNACCSLLLAGRAALRR